MAGVNDPSNALLLYILFLKGWICGRALAEDTVLDVVTLVIGVTLVPFTLAQLSFRGDGPDKVDV